MRSFSESLSQEMEAQLAVIHSQSSDPLHYSPLAVKYLIGILEKLKSFCIHYEFRDKAEEIEFFREVKPRFAARLIYYNEMYSISLNRPFGGSKQLYKYYREYLQRLDAFYDVNGEFCRYYRSGSQQLDKRYFIRRRLKLPMSFDSAYLQADHRFSTAHDYTVARLLALNQLHQDLEKSMQAIIDIPAPVDPTRSKQLIWTAPKVWLVELIYALHAEGVFAEGRIDLKSLVMVFEGTFGVALGQYHKTFLEMRERKSERAKFLSALRERLLQRMDDADAL